MPVKKKDSGALSSVSQQIIVGVVVAVASAIILAFVLPRHNDNKQETRQEQKIETIGNGKPKMSN